MIPAHVSDRQFDYIFVIIFSKADSIVASLCSISCNLLAVSDSASFLRSLSASFCFIQSMAWLI